MKGTAMRNIPIIGRLLLAALCLVGFYQSAHAQTVGTYTEQSGITKNAIGVVQVSGTVAQGGTATPADATSNTNVNASRDQSFGMVFNGVSWDRQEGDVNGTVVQPALSSTFWRYNAASGGIVNTTTAVTVKAAAGAAIRNYICTLNIGHDTLGAASEFVIRDGAAGPVMFLMKLQTAANEGVSEITFSPCLRGTANTLVEVATATVSGGTYINLSGYTGN